MRPSVVSNARWLAISRAVFVGLQFVSVVWLSRLLTPADYGLIAMAFVVTGFTELVRDMGIGSALIQKEDLSSEGILTAFWFTAALGAILGLIVASAAQLFAIAFGAPELTGILAMLALTFPILGSTTVQQALLERHSRFALLARVEIVSGTLALAVAVTAAYLGARAYSLALQYLAYSVVSAVQLWFASSFRPQWFWSKQELRTIRRFSNPLVAFSVINYLAANSDKIIIGRFLGPQSLGPYSLAFRIILFPLQNLSRVAARALYPVMSRQQEAPDEMASLYLRTLSMIAFITAPMMMGLFVIRDLFTAVVLGDQWTPVAGVLAWLAPVAFVTSLTCTTGSALLARGRSDVLFALGVAGAVLQVPCFLIGLKWGVTGVAAGYCVATVISSVWDFYFVLKVLGQKPSRLWHSISSPLIFAFVMALVLRVSWNLLPFDSLAATLQLVLLTFIGAATYFSLALVFARKSLWTLFGFLRWG